jgi:hypothetical protein
MILGLTAALAGGSSLAAGSASAANSPTFRDCSLTAGLDPDFVQLSGVKVGPEGMLTVPRGQKSVDIEASESADPGDSEGHDTLKVTVTAAHMHSQKISGAEKGKVHLSIPLRMSRRLGRSYTISWAATFDSANHKCPSEQTPQNTTPKPFVVTVA